MADVSKVIEIIKRIGADIEANKEFLTELDNIIADGDHGINMDRGFKAVDAIIPTLEDKDIGTILKQAVAKDLIRVCMSVPPHKWYSGSIIVNECIFSDSSAIRAFNVITSSPAAEIILSFTTHFE